MPLYLCRSAICGQQTRTRAPGSVSSKFLEQLVPDGPAGKTPAGDWYELVGSAYDRTLYGFQIETSAAQGDKFIAVYNARPNRESYKLVSRNCADLKDGLHGETSRHHWAAIRVGRMRTLGARKPPGNCVWMKTGRRCCKYGRVMP